MVHSQRRLFNLLAIKRKLKGRILTDFEMAQIQVKSQVLLDHCYLPVRTVHPNGVNLHVSLINDVKRYHLRKKHNGASNSND